MSHFIRYKNINVHFSDMGKGKAVVLLHGFLENSSMWDQIFSKLSEKYRVVCIDLLGHGKTENLGYIHTMESQAALVKAVLDHLRLRRYVLIGHSMGGYIALSFMRLYPKNVKAFCLMNSTAKADDQDKITNRNRAIKAVKQHPKSFVKSTIPMLFSEENRAIYANEIDEITKEALEMSSQGIIATLEGMKIRKNNTLLLEKSTVPMLLIIGKKDPVLNYHALIEQAQNTAVEICEFPDGHMSHIENTGELIAALLAFLRKC